MLALQPSTQPTLLSRLNAAEPAYAHPLVVYLSNSIKRDVRLLAAMGALAESGAKVIASYLPHATAEDDIDDTAVLRALGPATRTAAAVPGAKRLNRQRSETAPLRPPPHGAAPLQPQRAPGSPRKDRPRHEGLSARLGAFFNKLSLDPETSPRASKGSLSPAPSPRSATCFKLAPGPETTSPTAGATARMHERSMSDAPLSPPEERRLPHRVTVSCAPGLRDADGQRKPSQGSHRSGYSGVSATLADDSSGRSSASTLATRKRSFTHLGLSMEAMSPGSGRPLPGPRGQQLRRCKPSAHIAALQPRLALDGMARLAAPANSLGLVLQSSLAVKSRPTPAPIRTQRLHAGSGSGPKEPRSPTRLNCLSGIVARAEPKSPVKSPAPMAFPPMPSEACQEAMLSEAAPRTPPPAPRALSDSSMDSSSLASLVVVATAAHDYASGVKGDLEFARGERIVIQSRVNDDWWFGSILPAAGRGSTGRSGMFPRTHVSLA
ncbi:hypothetical protein IWW56_004082 [Coemansia sp. RSA 2131]|nr:hypothetical protein IWW56_004082 [Coemansia sp. RSA 2131]